MKLYVMAGACSMVPHTALEWSGADYHIELVSLADTKTDSYLAMNPQGAVPLLVENKQEDDFILSQNVAILEYVDSLYPNAGIFGPNATDTKSKQQRAKVWQWLAFCNADVHKSFGPLFHVGNFLSEETCQQALKDNAVSKILAQFSTANDALNGQDYLTGADITIADVYFYVLLRWAKSMKINFSQYSNLEPFFARVESNQGVQAIIQQEKLKPMAD